MSEATANTFLPNYLRRFCARVWDPEARSTTIGVVGAILVHLFLFWVGPRLLRFEHVGGVLHHRPVERQFNIEMEPETFEAPKAQQKSLPQQFVETNPDAPENIPDQTNNFGAQNQQVAQEKPTPNGKSERPAMEGKKDFDSTQIVSGQLRKPTEQAQPLPMPEVPPVPASAAQPRAEQNPLPGFEKLLGNAPDAYGTTKAPDADRPRDVPERVEGEKDAPIVDGAMGMRPAIDPRRPRPRPTIVTQQQVRPAILAENKIGTANVGITAINAKFSNYGAYLQRLVEAVQISWDDLLSAGKTYPPPGTYVVVRFALNSKGGISRIVEVDNHSSDLGSRACVSAITNRAPYGEWTEDMIAVLGEESELVFTFYYQ
ncbi:hypothetical protein [Opitutus sp. ER46]|uniref:hypothetical protein n=1 Tax=Opitutus sp. ER46 TaxID=2161864 RepID=UPI000D2FA1AF|nr:hypothetical protein [Opitutus sp. ER46]PTX94351.1 hypothetical protein DB354_11385 [Opitutus sp. ER46]